MTDAAPLLHGEGGFLEVLEDGAEIVRDRPHDEAVEERDVAARAGACDDATRGQELEIRERVLKALLPRLADARLLDAGASRSQARPGIRDARFEPIRALGRFILERRA